MKVRDLHRLLKNNKSKKRDGKAGKFRVTMEDSMGKKHKNYYEKTVIFRKCKLLYVKLEIYRG